MLISDVESSKLYSVLMKRKSEKKNFAFNYRS